MKRIVLIVALFFGVQLPAIIIAPDKGVTELMKACEKGSVKQVKALIESGADVNAITTVWHKTALSFALKNPDCLNIVNVLLKNGADPTLPADLWRDLFYQPTDNIPKRAVNLNNTALMLLNGSLDVNVDEVITYAIRCTRDVRVIKWLIDAGVNVNSRTFRRPLLIWARNNEIQKYLLDRGADPNIRDFNNLPAIYYARNLQRLKNLFQYGAKWIVKDDSGQNLNLISQWAEWIDREMLEQAIRHGCKIDRKGLIKIGNNPALPDIYSILADKFSPLPVAEMAQTALRNGRLENFRLLESNMSDSEFSTVNWYNRILGSKLQKEEKLKLLNYLIKKRHVSVNDASPRTHVTSLMCFVKRPETVKFLIEQGAHVNDYDRKGFNALYYLIKAYRWRMKPDERLAVLEVLRKKGATLKQKNKKVNLLIVALSNELEPEIIKRLVELGEDVNFKTQYGVTPLMVACALYKSDIVKLLIDKGARIEDQDDTGWTPLFYACHYFRESRSLSVMTFQPRNRKKSDANDTVQLLLARGARADILDKQGQSVLTEAAAWANAETIRTLIKAGGKKIVNAHDAHNRNAIMYATNLNQDIHVSEVLLKNGANPNSIMKDEKLPERFMRITDLYGFELNKIFQVGFKPEFHNCAGFGWYEPPLFVAVYRGDIDLVKLLLKYGANPNIRYYSYRDIPEDILKIAGRRSDKLKKILIAAGAKTQTRRRETPENLRIKEVMIKANLPPSEIEKFMNPPIPVRSRIPKQTPERIFGDFCKTNNLRAIKEQYNSLLKKTGHPPRLYHAIFCAAEYNSLDVVTFLIERCPDWKNATGNLLLHCAAKNEKHPEVIKFLCSQFPEKVIKGKSYRRSVLFSASSPAIIKYLLSIGFDVNETDDQGESLIFRDALSSDRNWKNKVRFLLKCGADINTRDDSNRTIMDSLYASRRWSSFDDKPREKMLFLLKNGADPNIKCNGKVLLDRAVKHSDGRMFEILVFNGADINLISEDLRKTTPYIRRRIEELRKKTSAGK